LSRKGGAIRLPEMTSDLKFPLDPDGDSVPRGSGGQPPSGHHLATVSHEGRFWDVYVEFDDDPRRTDSFGGLLCFSPAEEGEDLGPLRTATILIEPSYEEVLHRARNFETHHLVALLRSCLPGD
jgi:hypothetical protein